MRIFWTAVALMALLIAGEARADTVYLKDGDTFWGTEVLEVGDVVTVVRPGGNRDIPKQDVVKIERSQVSIPRFYSPPGGAPAAPPADSMAPPAPAQAAEAPAAAPPPGFGPASGGAPPPPPPPPPIGPSPGR
jgi:hypothetical protein